jgi:hypothetical protein
MLAHRALDWGALGIAVGVALVLFTGGLVYFRQTERSFADIA